MDKNHFAISARNEDINIRFENLKSKPRSYTDLEIRTPEVDISYDFTRDEIRFSSGSWRDRNIFLFNLISVLHKQKNFPDRAIEVLLAYGFEIVYAK